MISGRYGIANVFFSGCNMRCMFCQNFQISRHGLRTDDHQPELPGVIAEIEAILDAGASLVGFVSPSHVFPQMRAIINALHERGRNPGFVYNTNGYDKKETIASLDGIIDVWLPDLKYVDDSLAVRYSDAPDYPAVAGVAIREMYRQVGSSVRLDDQGSIERGLVIRHLVLPGEVENSRAVLRWIAENLSVDVHISLMSQYYPAADAVGHSGLGRSLHRDEYEQVVEEFYKLGFHRGWIQEMDSPGHYRPDFHNDHPFEL